MAKIDLSKYKIEEFDEYLPLKMIIQTLGFVKSYSIGEVEHIFLNPLFRNQGLASKLLKLVKEKTRKEITLQELISPVGSKLLNS